MTDSLLPDPGSAKINSTWFRVLQEMIVSGTIAKIKPVGFSVYCVLKAYSRWTTGRIPITYAQIGAAIGRSADVVSRSIDTLEDHGYITVTRQRGRPNSVFIIERLPVRHSETEEVIGELSWRDVPAQGQTIAQSIAQFRRTGISDGKVIFSRRVSITEMEETIEIIHSDRAVGNS